MRWTSSSSASRRTCETSSDPARSRAWTPKRGGRTKTPPPATAETATGIGSSRTRRERWEWRGRRDSSPRAPARAATPAATRAAIGATDSSTPRRRSVAWPPGANAETREAIAETRGAIAETRAPPRPTKRSSPGPGPWRWRLGVRSRVPRRPPTRRLVSAPRRWSESPPRRSIFSASIAPVPRIPRIPRIWRIPRVSRFPPRTLSASPIVFSTSIVVSARSRRARPRSLAPRESRRRDLSPRREPHVWTRFAPNSRATRRSFGCSRNARWRSGIRVYRGARARASPAVSNRAARCGPRGRIRSSSTCFAAQTRSCSPSNASPRNSTGSWTPCAANPDPTNRRTKTKPATFATRRRRLRPRTTRQSPPRGVATPLGFATNFAPSSREWNGARRTRRETRRRGRTTRRRARNCARWSARRGVGGVAGGGGAAAAKDAGDSARRARRGRSRVRRVRG